MFDTSRLDQARKERRVRLAAEQAKLLPRVRQALLQAREEYGLTAGYIVGSLCSPDLWRSDSDVDVAIRGGTPHILEVMRIVEEASGRVVDTIDLDRHPTPERFTDVGIEVFCDG